MGVGATSEVAGGDRRRATRSPALVARGRRLRRDLAVLVILAASVAGFTLPASASAAVTIGADLTQVSHSSFDCTTPDHPCTWIQSAPSQGESVTVPFAGTIVSWAIGAGHAGDKFSLRVVRLVGPGTPLANATFIGAGTSAQQTLPATPKNLNGPYPVNMPVQAGDTIGVDAPSGNSALIPSIDGQGCLTTPVTPYVSVFAAPDLADGGSPRMVSNFEAICSEIAIQATVAALPSSSATTSGCSASVSVTPDPATAPKAVLFTLDGGAVQTAPVSGSSATLAIPAGMHTLQYWGEDALGAQEATHHSLTYAVAPPSVTIASDQAKTSYEVGERGSVTTTVTDPGGALVANPSGAGQPLTTSRSGSFLISRTATDNCANAVSATFAYTVAPLPRVSSLRVSPRDFYVHRTRRRRHPGTKVSYADTRSATTRLVMLRSLPGIRRGKRCVAGSLRGVKRSHRCTRTVTIETLTHRDRAGRNVVALSGKVHGRALPAALYSLALTPRNAVGVAGSTLTAHLRIVASS